MNFRILLLTLAIVFALPKLYAQAVCNPLPNCIQNPGIEPSSIPLGTPITNSSIPGWSVLLGTPITGPGVVGSRGFELVSDVSAGEGMYTCYNFVKGRTYRVCFRAYNTTAVNSGTLTVEAHNGSTGWQTIWSNNLYLSGPPHVDRSHTFTANDNYSQLRFYTNATPNSGNPYAIVIDDVGVIEVPTLTASPDTIDICDSTTLTASSNNPLNIFWSPNHNLSAITGTSVTAKPCSSEIYTVNFTSNCPLYGCDNNSVQVAVTVLQATTTVTSSLDTINFCDSAILTATSSNPNMLITWSPTFGLTPTTGNVVVAKPCATTVYTATFECPTNDCISMKTIKVNVEPDGKIINRSPGICRGAIDLKFSAPCPGFTYSWIGPKTGVVLSTADSLYLPTSTVMDEGIYELTVASVNGCTAIYVINVVLNCCTVTADFDVIDCNPIRFVNTTTTTNASGLQGAEWYWDFGDGNFSTITNPSHLYYAMGPHTVCLSVVLSDSGFTCCDKICKDITVCDFTCVPKSAFGFSILNPVTGQVQFLDKSVGGGYPCSWTWKVNGAPQSSSQNPVITLGGSGTYQICLDVGFCQPMGQICTEEWCEDIVIP